MKIILTVLTGFIVLNCCSIYGQSDTLNQKLQNIFTKYKMVGMSVAVVKEDSIIYSKGYGQRDISRNLPVDDKTCYRIASISKIFASTALLQLYDKGKFKLDDDISQYLGYTLRSPKFPNDVITFRKVLSHTAGLRDGTGYSNFLAVSYSQNPEDIKTLLLSTGKYYTADMWSDAKAPSANYFQYANINFGLIGTLVEKISGERFDVYCRNKIFIPLGLDGSFNIQDLYDINNVAVLYKAAGTAWQANADNYNGIKPAPINLANYIPGTNGLIFAPQGGVRIGASDLSRFMIMLKNNGIYKGIRILEDSTVQIMKKSVWISSGSNGDNYYGIFNQYALGISTTTNLLKGETLIGHPGEAYGLISDMYFSADKKYGIVFITNGGKWGNGVYSGWYNVEEEVYNAAISMIKNSIPTSDTMLINENFESIKNSGDTLSGWSFNNSKTWILSGYGHNSDKYAGWDETHSTDHWITTPKVTNPGTLTFWLAAYSNASALGVKVQVSADGKVWTEKGSYKSKASGGDFGVDFVQETIKLNLSGSYFIRWTTADYVSGGFYIDDVSVTGIVTSIQQKNDYLIDTYILEQNYPNPFNPSTIIKYNIPKNSHVSIKVFDILGKEVKTVVSEIQNAGNHTVDFDASKLSSGIYFYTIKSGEFSSCKKMVLIK